VIRPRTPDPPQPPSSVLREVQCGIVELELGPTRRADDVAVDVTAHRLAQNTPTLGADPGRATRRDFSGVGSRYTRH
jgi:hypothetical protein